MVKDTSIRALECGTFSSSGQLRAMLGALRRVQRCIHMPNVYAIAYPRETSRSFGALTNKPHAFVAEAGAQNSANKRQNTHDDATTGGLAAEIFERRRHTTRNIVEEHGWMAVERSVANFLQNSGPLSLHQLRNFLGSMHSVPQVEHRRKLASLMKPELLRLFPSMSLTDTVNCLFYLKLAVPRSSMYQPNETDQAAAEWLLRPVLARLASEPRQMFKPEHVTKLYFALGQLSPDVDGVVQALNVANDAVKQMSHNFTPQQMALWLSAFRNMPLDIPAAQASLNLLVATLQESMDKWPSVPARELGNMFISVQAMGVESKQCVQLVTLLAEALERCTAVNSIPLVCAALRCIHRAQPDSVPMQQLSRSLAQYLLLVDEATPQLRFHLNCMENVRGDTHDTRMLFQRLIKLMENIPDHGKNALQPVELTNILDGARSLPSYSPELASLTDVLGRKLSAEISPSHGGNLSHAVAQLSVLNDKLPGVPLLLHKLATAIRQVDDLVAVRWARCVSGLANMHSDCPQALEVLDALNEHLQKRNFKAPSSVVEIADGIRNMDSSLPQVQRFVSNLLRHYFNLRQLPDQFFKLVEMKEVKLDEQLADQVVQLTTALLSSNRVPAPVGLVALRPIDPNHPKLANALNIASRQLIRGDSLASFEMLLSTMQSLQTLQHATLDTNAILEVMANRVMDPNTILDADQITALCGAARGLSDENSMVALLLYHLTTRLAELSEPLTEQQVIQVLPAIKTLSANNLTQLLTTIASKLNDAEFVPTTPEFVSALAQFRSQTTSSPAVRDLLLAIARRLSVMQMKVAPRTVCDALLATAQCPPPQLLIDALLQRIDTAHTISIPISVTAELCRSFEGCSLSAASRERFLALLSQGITHSDEPLSTEHIVLFLSKLQSLANSDMHYRAFAMSVASKMGSAATTTLSSDELVKAMTVLQHFSAADAPATPLLRYFTHNLAVLRDAESPLSADEIRSVFWSLQRMDSQFPAVQDLMQQLLYHLDTHPQVSADVIEGMLYGLRNKHSCEVVRKMVEQIADRVEHMEEPFHNRTLKALTTVRLWNERQVSSEALRLADALAAQLPKADIVLTPSLAKAVDAFEMRLTRCPKANGLREAVAALLAESPRP